MKTLWQTPLIFLPYARSAFLSKPGSEPGDLFKNPQEQSVRLDLSLSRSDVNDPELEKSRSNSLGMQSFYPPISPQAHAHNYPERDLLGSMRDNVEANYGFQHGSSSMTPPREIDFLGNSPKRNFFSYLSGELPLARSQNWAESRAPSSGTNEEYDPGTRRKKHKVTFTPSEVATEDVGGWTFPGETHGNGLENHHDGRNSLGFGPQSHPSLSPDHPGAVRGNQQSASGKPEDAAHILSGEISPPEDYLNNPS
ncbi:hypothetical protein PGTUg99_010289 [Puccinia graminis f. sp. tritici]|uniref:Uncharacterized protein n=1 Tax=Puccinia graminis f. sp. tritici TaxID=56615 RepID=A0A5B0RWJ3_PUCGR|nr:hypothetical protein PGTUg99_010289 [Puccinia graminis f. sp. tritici]